jgi:hypothetical protein
VAVVAINQEETVTVGAQGCCKKRSTKVVIGFCGLLALAAIALFIYIQMAKNNK